MSEFDHIRWLRGQVPAASRVPVGIGDDCAVVTLDERRLLVTTDMLLDGSHFRLDEVGPRRVGRKSLAVNLSDIAAMGGRPIAAVVSLGLPRRGAGQIAAGLFEGMRPLAEEFATAIVGGDTNTWAGPLVVSITVMGEPGPHGPILRSGAKPGDWLLVTGPLGGSLAGKHFDFTPRIREALALQDVAVPHAMIDLSDGLAGDVGHLCAESSVGVVLHAETIPLAPTVVRDGREIEHALRDGEDFELAIAVAPDDGKRLLREQPIAGIRLVRVGVFQAEPGVFLEMKGTRHAIEPRGYEHRFDDD